MTLRVASEEFLTVAQVRADQNCGCVTDGSPDDATVLAYIQQASDIIATVSGLGIAGRQHVVARPCRRWCPDECCVCCGLDVIPLGPERVEVTSVNIDGVELDASEYWLHWNRVMWVLARKPAAGETHPRSWPHWQDRWRADTENDTFSIYFTQGIHVDAPIIQSAALEIVCDLASEDAVRAKSLEGVTSMTLGGATAMLESTENRLQRIANGEIGPMMRRLMGVMAPEGRSSSEVWAPELTYGWELNLEIDS